MDELVKRSDVLAAYYDDFYDYDYFSFEDVLNSVPTVNAVRVVRCRECAIPHNKYTGCPKLNGLVTPPDFYCSYGERKEDG